MEPAQATRRRTLLYIGGALLLAVALLLAGYALSGRDAPAVQETTAGDPGSASGALISTGTAGSAPTAPPEATGGTSAATSGSRGRSSSGLTAAEAAALEAELAAIEKSLNSMGMPSDSDFKDIESGLK